MSRRPGVILTGGSSRRMGADKAFVVVEGRPMAIAVADALWEAGCHPVECQGGDVAGLNALGLPAVADDPPDAGPVAAIAAASARHAAPIVAAACDLPWLDAATVEAVVRAGEQADRPAVATADGHHHLLVYVSAGSFAGFGGSTPLKEALGGLDAVEVPVDAAAVRNVNAPDDLPGSTAEQSRNDRP